MDDVDRYQLKAMNNKLDKLVAGQEDIKERVIRMESQNSPQKIEELEHAVIAIDKRLVAVETRGIIFSGGVAALTAGAVAWFVDFLGAGPK